MLIRFLTLLPFSISVLFLFQYILRNGKSETQKMFMWVGLVCATYLFTDAMYVLCESHNYHTYLLVDIISHFVTPLLSIVAFLTLYSFRHSKEERRRHYWMFLVSPLVGVPNLVCVLSIGFDHVVDFLQSYELNMGITPQYDVPAFRLYMNVSSHFYFLFMAVEMLLLIAYVIYYLNRKHFGFASLWRFVFRGGEATPLILECWCVLAFSLLCSLRMSFGREFWLTHQVFSASISLFFGLIIYSICYIGMIAHMYEGTLREMLHPLLLLPVREMEEGIVGGISSNDDIQAEEYALVDQLIDLMENKQLFRNPNLSIDELAVRLNANQTLVAQIIDRHMGVSFREYTNRLRVLHAKRCLYLHPNQTQEKIALESGFVDAAAFNKKFRQMEGMTPREYSKTRLRQQRVHS